VIDRVVTDLTARLDGLLRSSSPIPFAVNAFAIGRGVAVILVTTLSSVIVPARWLASARGGVEGNIEYQGAERRSVIASAITRLPFPPSAGAGARLALEPGHGRSATPVRSAIVGLALAVATLVAAFGFAASMDHFASTPRLWGLAFDFGAGQPYLGSAFEKTAIPVLRDDEHVQDLMGGNFQQNLALRGPRGATQEAAWAIETIKGHQVTTTMLEGRWPESSDEIGLGRETLSTLGVRLGDTVTATVAGTSRDLRIVGIPVFPTSGSARGSVGRGDDDGRASRLHPKVTDNLVFGNFAPGTDRAAVIARWNKEALDGLDASMSSGGLEDLGTTVRGTARSRALPLQLPVPSPSRRSRRCARLLTSVQRRRRDLAILQALGFRATGGGDDRMAGADARRSRPGHRGSDRHPGGPVGVGRVRLSPGRRFEPGDLTAFDRGRAGDAGGRLPGVLGPGLMARRVRPAAVLKAE
jgi:hypothetical protein